MARRTVLPNVPNVKQSIARYQAAQLTLPWEGPQHSSSVVPSHQTQTTERPIRTPEGLRTMFERTAGRPVDLFITDNATSLFSMRPASRGGMTVRLHHMFLRADDDVLGELARYVKSGRGSTPRFWGFVKANTHLLKEASPRRISLETEGRYHDLGEMFDRLNAEHFRSELACAVTWGRRPKGGRIRARRTLGSYSPHGDTIRISPVLDSARVPRYFVEYIVYHEMLHARLGVKMKNGRRALHTAEFKELERRFPLYERAIAWERKHGF